MLVSKKFIQDFAQLANRFEWRQQEIDEMKACVRENNGMREYIETLAQAFRDGYAPCKANNFQRLEAWQIKRLEEV